MSLDQLLSHALRGDAEQSLAILREKPDLVNEAWAGEEFVSKDGKWVWQGTTALMAACKSGNTVLIEGLLELGADMSARGEGGWDVLMCASRFGHVSAATILLDRGADVNTRCHTNGWTALVLAAYRDHLDMCLLLIARGADLLAVIDGRTALDLYGDWVKITVEEKEERKKALRAAWEAGPHPSQVQRRKDEAWERRKQFVCVLVNGDFQPTAARKAQLALLHPPLPPDVPIPRLPCATLAERRALLRDKIFTHPGLWKKIASYI